VDTRPHLHCFHASCEQIRLETAQQIREALESAGYELEPPAKRSRMAPAAFSREKLAETLAGRDHVTLGWLARLSPLPTSPREMPTGRFLDQLYDPRLDKVLLFDEATESQGTGVWPADLGLDEWYESADGSWFLPQPIDGKWRMNPRTSRKTRRSAECITDWRFMVIESDTVPPADWVKVLTSLALPIVAIYSSGGRSLHALAKFRHPTKAAWESAMNEQWRTPLIELGADPASLTAVRLTRLPNSTRGENVQRLFWFNPAATSEPIMP
jgi:hypothetical protein